MIDLKIEDDTRDISIENGDFVILSEADETAQSILIRIRMFFGEWFLDTTQGTRYFGLIFQKQTDLVATEIELRQRLLGTVGVKSVLEFSLELIGNRTLKVRFKVLAENDTLITDNLELTT